MVGERDVSGLVGRGSLGVCDEVIVSPSAFTRDQVRALYASYAPVVFRRARLFLGRDADAWDVVQEVFERLLKPGSGFRGEAQPMTWIYRVTTNLALNALRGRALREPASSADPPEKAPEQVVGVGDAIEARQWLQRWLALLDDRELEVASLLYLDGLSQQEVAEVLGLSRKTIGREVEALRTKLERLGAPLGRKS